MVYDGVSEEGPRAFGLVLLTDTRVMLNVRYGMIVMTVGDPE